MKKLEQIMAELGFNKNAPTSTKEAFIKHLIAQAGGAPIMTPSEKSEVLANPKIVSSLLAKQSSSIKGQLAFDFMSEVVTQSKRKKSAS